MQSDTLFPMPESDISSFLASAVDKVNSLSKSNSPESTSCAHFKMYFSRKPALIEDNASLSSAAMVCADGKE